MKVTALSSRAFEFACHSAACRPPNSGGTGGSTKSGAAPSLPSIRAELRQHRGLKSDSSSGGAGARNATGSRAYAPGKDYIHHAGGSYKIHVKDVWRDAGASLVKVTGKEAAGALAAHHKELARQSRQVVMNDLNKISTRRASLRASARVEEFYNHVHDAVTGRFSGRAASGRAGFREGSHGVGKVATTGISRRGGFPQVATVRSGKVSFKNSVKATLNTAVSRGTKPSTLADRHAVKMAESAIQKLQAIRHDKAAQKRQGIRYPNFGK